MRQARSRPSLAGATPTKIQTPTYATTITLALEELLCGYKLLETHVLSKNEAMVPAIILVYVYASYPRMGLCMRDPYLQPT